MEGRLIIHARFLKKIFHLEHLPGNCLPSNSSQWNYLQGYLWFHFFQSPIILSASSSCLLHAVCLISIGLHVFSKYPGDRHQSLLRLKVTDALPRALCLEWKYSAQIKVLAEMAEGVSYLYPTQLVKMLTRGSITMAEQGGRLEI